MLTEEHAAMKRNFTVSTRSENLSKIKSLLPKIKVISFIDLQQGVMLVRKASFYVSFSSCSCWILRLIDCVTSVKVSGIFWCVFSGYWPEYGDLRILSECGKIRTRKNSKFGRFSRNDRQFLVNFSNRAR